MKTKPRAIQAGEQIGIEGKIKIRIKIKSKSRNWCSGGKPRDTSRAEL
jgi:hypothetical protein